MSLHGQLDVTIGDAVEFTFTVSNIGDEPVKLEFRDGRAADFNASWNVSDSDGYLDTVDLTLYELDGDGNPVEP